MLIGDDIDEVDDVAEAERGLGFARLPVSLPTFEDFENGLDSLVLFVAEFPLDARNHVPGAKGLVDFIFLVLEL